LRAAAGWRLGVISCLIQVSITASLSHDVISA
jgi:hypothetical protein